MTSRLLRGQDSRSPGRARIIRNTIAQGRPEVSAEPVVTAACFSFCRRAMGEASSRPSLRPLVSGGRDLFAKLGRDHAARTDVHARSKLQARFRWRRRSHPFAQVLTNKEPRDRQLGLALRDARLRRAPQGEERRLDPERDTCRSKPARSSPGAGSHGRRAAPTSRPNPHGEERRLRRVSNHEARQRAPRSFPGTRSVTLPCGRPGMA